MQAKAVKNEFFNIVQETVCYWGSKAIVIQYPHDYGYDDLPKVIEHDNSYYGLVSYNSDHFTAFYSVRSYNNKVKKVKWFFYCNAILNDL